MTKEQFSKLPKFAQEIINRLEMERDAAIRELNSFCDSQTKANFYVEELVCTGEDQGPSNKVKYIQGRKLSVSFRDINLDILLSDGSSSRDPGNHLSWNYKEMPLSLVAMVPKCLQGVVLISPKDLKGG